MPSKLPGTALSEPDIRLKVVHLPVQADGQPDAIITVTTRATSAKGPRIAIVNGLHGEERTGALLIQDLLARELGFQGTLAVIPCANPTATLSGTRLTPEDGVDLNRTFPGDAHGSLSHRVAHALFTFLQDFDLVIDVHSFPKMRMPSIGVFCNQGNTEQKRHVLELVSRMQPDYIWLLDTATGEAAKAGSLVEALLKRGMLSFGIEVPDIELISDELECRSVDGLQRVIESFTESSFSNTARTVPAIERVAATSSQSGLFIRCLDVNAKVAEGDVVGHMVRLDTFEKAPVRAPTAGIVLCTLEKTVVSAGQRVVIIGKAKEIVV